MVSAPTDGTVAATAATSQIDSERREALGAESEAPGRVCSSCGEDAPADANWCEACGADLDAVPEPPAYVPTGPCVSCEATIDNITDDGWCQICGTKQPDPADHFVDDQSWFAIVSDKGRKHGGNEDAGAIGATETQMAMVVCDGVGSTSDAHQASQAAAVVARDVVLAGANGDPAQLLTSAVNAAQQAILDATSPGENSPPSSTLVAGLVSESETGFRIDIGWLGDSRAYWVDSGAAELLTHDHTWANEQRELGDLDDATIDSDERRHSITRWLGQGAIDVDPELARLDVPGPGLLLLCSDGLWNYAATDAEIHDLVLRVTANLGADLATVTLLDLCEALVAFANDAGGHDNITVALARFPPELHAPDPTTSTADPI